ncbi:probable RNA polymerase II nuclear localization protein SLC7A6OS [Contarinia nasturtii]|uniref:probable RNA polymerase II nuclear localization protein SLC7A6OS n=1 Tax=Contarinia nasturtii TaxID=265458 RepID=UPI0012D395C9|nr:probable RNA polymerase II nuclear localization protein SLC7A6OS [Contarinia nasturtii]
MASTVIRVKRRITDEPFDTFVLNCKRFKSSDGSENNQNGAKTEGAAEQLDIKNTILKLAATVSTEDDINTHLTKLRKSEAEEIVRKTRKPNRIINKLREQFKNDAQNHRFKVVNCFRSIGNDPNRTESTDGDTEQEITIVDVVKEEQQPQSKSEPNEIEPSAATSSTQNDIDFVWDLYYLKERVEPIENNYETISITPFNNFYYQNDDNFNDTDYDSDDSNNEAHWRNDYPDTDDGLSVDSIDEEDMRRAVEDLNLNSDADNLSSDDENECNYSEDPVVHFMNESDEDEYKYFKKHGRRKNHGALYRTNNPAQRNKIDEEDSDIDDDRSSDESDNSASSVSPLVSCDESDDNK